MTLNENEIDILRWLIRAEIKVQTLLLNESDGTLYTELNDLYDKISSFMPNQESIGSMQSRMPLGSPRKPAGAFK